MRVLVWNSWITAAGGMERVALSIANGLAERPDTRVVLAGPYDSVPLLQARISPAVHFVPCEFTRRVDALARNYSTLRRLVRDHSIDVISAHGSVIPLLPLGVPVAWTEHGPRYGDRPVFQGVRRVAWHGVRHRLLRGDWRLVACSRYVRDRLCPQFDLDPKRAAVILNGVPDADRLRTLDPPRFTEPFRLGFLGRLEEEKHPMDVFELDRRLQERGCHCEWHVFGAGAQAGDVRRRAEGNPRIHVHGLAAHAAEALAQMDALAFLSHGQMEGLPTVILEARLARRPVIAWNVTANPEATGPFDELVAPFDLGAFADAIERVCTRRIVPAQLGNEFSYQRMIDEYWQLLREMSGQRAMPAVGAHRVGAAHKR